MRKKLSKKNILPIEYNLEYKGVVYNGNDYAVEVKESDEGIIIDVFIRDGEHIETLSFNNWSEQYYERRNETFNLQDLWV